MLLHIVQLNYFNEHLFHNAERVFFSIISKNQKFCKSSTFLQKNVNKSIVNNSCHLPY